MSLITYWLLICWYVTTGLNILMLKHLWCWLHCLNRTRGHDILQAGNFLTECTDFAVENYNFCRASCETENAEFIFQGKCRVCYLKMLHSHFSGMLSNFLVRLQKLKVNMKMFSKTFLVVSAIYCQFLLIKANRYSILSIDKT